MLALSMDEKRISQSLLNVAKLRQRIVPAQRWPSKNFPEAADVISSIRDKLYEKRQHGGTEIAGRATTRDTCGARPPEKQQQCVCACA